MAKGKHSRHWRVNLILGFVLTFTAGIPVGVLLHTGIVSISGEIPPSQVIGITKVGNNGRLAVLAPAWKQPDALSSFPPGWIPLQTFVGGNHRGMDSTRLLTPPISGIGLASFRLEWKCNLPTKQTNELPASIPRSSGYVVTVLTYQTGGLLLTDPFQMKCPHQAEAETDPFPSPCGEPASSPPPPCSDSFFLEIRSQVSGWTLTVLGLLPPPRPSRQSDHADCPSNTDYFLSRLWYRCTRVLHSR
jgi:hypothetical protein